MKQVLKNSDYSFDPANRLIIFSDTLSDIKIENIGIITNVTDGILIYQFNNPALGGTILKGVLTLTYNTTSMSSTDKLQIVVDLDEEIKITENEKLLHEILDVVKDIRDLIIKL